MLLQIDIQVSCNFYENPSNVFCRYTQDYSRDYSIWKGKGNTIVKTCNLPIVLLSIYLKEMKLCVCQKWNYINIYSSFICNSSKPKKNPDVINGWMVKHTMAHPYLGILLSNKKEWTIGILNNLNKSSKSYVEWKNKKAKAILNRSGCICITFLKL